MLHQEVTQENTYLLLTQIVSCFLIKKRFGSKIKDPFYSSYEICFRIHRICYCTTKLWGSGYKPEPAVIFICVISEIVRLSAHDAVCGSKLFY